MRGRFAKDKPNAKIYVHTEPTTRFGGMDLPALVNNLGIQDKVFFPTSMSTRRAIAPSTCR